MMIRTKSRSPMNIRVVPTMSRTSVRRLMPWWSSWRCRVALPVANELREDVDLVLAQRVRRQRLRLVAGGIVREVGGDTAPVGHHAAEVLEAGEAVLDAPVVVVLVEEPEAVLVVERRSHAAL